MTADMGSTASLLSAGVGNSSDAENEVFQP